MARQWRIEFKGAIYHILSRGNQQQVVFKDKIDYEMFLEILGQASDRFSLLQSKKTLLSEQGQV